VERLQETQTSPVSGDMVRLRGRRWRVRETRTFADCRLLSLSEGSGERRVFIQPFDRAQLLARRRKIKSVTWRKWLRALQAMIADSSPVGGLRAAARMKIALFPYQLAPALELGRGRCRFLLADEVGLGKTIQAGLMLAELLDRGEAENVLILTPAGLRHQWAEELSRRFGIQVEVLDLARIRTLSASLPAGVNPWLVPSIRIVSFDFVKQPEVLRAVDSITWDLLIVDEAHKVATTCERGMACRELALNARKMLLLTATPHGGDEAAFDSLCGIGSHGKDDGIVIFRRTRADVGFETTRHVRMQFVRPSADEAEMYRLLRSYCRRVWREAGREDRAVRLAMIVLAKRALSSAGSLARSVERRLRLLREAGSGAVWQPLLPIYGPEADEEPSHGLEAPGLGDLEEECALLERLLLSARRASAAESKLRVIARLISRLNEPVIIFTEYRDTLLNIAASLPTDRGAVLLHGGLDVAVRREAEYAFCSGKADVLIATDAAGEGLNLHSRCRLVVNMELPWNPVRLEQRAGRVDRIGQSRRVHVINLVSSGTAEARILARLIERLRIARASMRGIADPLGSIDEEKVASMVMGESLVRLRHLPAASVVDKTRQSSEPERLGTEAGGVPAGSVLSAPVTLPGQLEDECRRLESIRRHASHAFGSASGMIDALELRGPWLATLPSRCRFGTKPWLLCVFRIRISDGAGRRVDEAVIPVNVPFGPRIETSTGGLRFSVETCLAAADEPLQEVVRRALERRLPDAQSFHRQALMAARSREQAILRRSALNQRIGVTQQGLFDRRAERRIEASRESLTKMKVSADVRISELNRSIEAGLAMSAELLLALVIAR
jgi:superfamily II DNA or RNA helicase